MLTFLAWVCYACFQMETRWRREYISYELYRECPCRRACMLRGIQWFGWKMASEQRTDPWFLLDSCLVPAEMYDAGGVVWCRRKCMMRAELHDICRIIWCMQNHMIAERAEVRLRRVPPVIADRVNDLTRSGLREPDEQKWYHDWHSSSDVHGASGDFFVV